MLFACASAATVKRTVIAIIGVLYVNISIVCACVCMCVCVRVVGVCADLYSVLAVCIGLEL